MGNKAEVFSDPDFDPAKAARNERKAGVAKNEKQRLQNIQHSKAPQAQSKAERKNDIATTLATSRISTASMGKLVTYNFIYPDRERSHIRKVRQAVRWRVKASWSQAQGLITLLLFRQWPFLTVLFSTSLIRMKPPHKRSATHLSQ